MLKIDNRMQKKLTEESINHDNLFNYSSCFAVMGAILKSTVTQIETICLAITEWLSKFSDFLFSSEALTISVLILEGAMKKNLRYAYSFT